MTGIVRRGSKAEAGGANAGEDPEHDGTEKGGRGLVIASIVTMVAVALLATFLLWPRTPAHVLVVGDSVTYMSFEDLRAEFDPDTDLEPYARPGYRSTDLLPLATKAIANRVDAGLPLDRAIFLVGYNDVWLDQTEHRDLEKMVAESARFQCAIWLTLPTRPGGKPPATGDFDPELAERWNARLARLVKQHKSLHLVTDWQKAIEGAPASRYLEKDGIHPNSAGQEKLAEIMHNKLQSSCRLAGL